MRLNEFIKARLKITFIISFIATIILSAFGGTVYYYYKKELVFEISDRLKSIAFDVARNLESSTDDWSVINELKIPEDNFVCIYNYSNGLLFYNKKMCNYKTNFTGFKVLDDKVIFGITLTKNFDQYHIYVGENLNKILRSVYKLKATIFYTFFGLSLIIFVFAFYISKYIVKPLQIALETQEKFIQNTSHDLKTPLSIISSNFYLIKQKNFKNIDKNINILEKNIEYMKKIINDMLFMANIGNKEKTKLNINSILKDLISDFETDIKEKNINLEIIEKENIDFVANYEDIKKLFSNLLENAIKYNEENGEIIIKIDKKEVSIKNTGQIISEKDKDLIFERFYRGDKARTSQGTGLGLSIVKEIAKSYNIKIKLKTDKKYNEFIIKF
ncbi:sensor histidine kinase [Hydrogenothermus marinus]|uniref:histidine kinase n=1 Tax=Hydrogenothermus marinus TaxID=133270 RepID=A0A3M0BQ79_9AQUI|nr:HAMP domain-containing sensor histidine kinase [Hydrogenothermus marinus]RMA93072.1 phospho-acceptor domain-containing protein [Hydrogenothermus marinus]